MHRTYDSYDNAHTGEDSLIDAEDNAKEAYPTWPVTDPTEDPLNPPHDSVMSWIPPTYAHLPEDRVETWTRTVEDSKSYIRHLTYGGSQLRNEIKKVKTRLVGVREELFRAFFPLDIPAQP